MKETIIGPDEQILLTGASGFIGASVLASLLEHGFCRVRCLVRPSSSVAKIEALVARYGSRAHVDLVRGNLLSRSDCAEATKGAAIIYHLAMGAGGRSFPDAFMNAVVTTRNLVEASLAHGGLKRFVNASSFAVYTNRNKRGGRLLDESCPTEEHPELRDAYCYAKVRQDALVASYGRQRGLPYVMLRPGVVYGPGKNALSGRVGLGTFGIFLHLGGGNRVPLTYVDNCAEAIALAGLVRGVDGEVFNIVDDDLPSSRAFLRGYRSQVRNFSSIGVPRPLSYLMCWLWERLSAWSDGQVPPFLTRRAWHAYWKGSLYSNAKAKDLLGWTPRVPTAEGLRRFWDWCRQEGEHA